MRTRALAVLVLALTLGDRPVQLDPLRAHTRRADDPGYSISPAARGAKGQKGPRLLYARDNRAPFRVMLLAQP